ncbi:MAG: transglycosylase SLT domain-containing protein [Candidatus Accumulibacter sp.]|nr:transglycosylase SLT domain-containing protein [Accumulibacter sp.]
MLSADVLKRMMPRRRSGVLYVFQYLAVMGLLFVCGFVLFPLNVPSSTVPEDTCPRIAALPDTTRDEADALSPQMKTALTYVARRYRVSGQALLPLFELAQTVSGESNIDPLLVIAVIGIESRFNPFAESPMGAQGLMQIIPRFHMDKLPADAGENPFLDPEINVRVGVRILEESIKRRGGLVPGLQYYAGSSDTSASYANRVLAEKQRLEQIIARAETAVTKPESLDREAPI